MNRLPRFRSLRLRLSFPSAISCSSRSWFSASSMATPSRLARPIACRLWRFRRLCLCVLWRLLRSRAGVPFRPMGFLRVSLLLSVAGFLALSVGSASRDAVASALLSAGTGAFEILMYYVLLQLAEDARLTEREREVFGLLARGRNARYIQETLVVSYNTVKTHVSHVYAKLGVHSQQELIDVVESGTSATVCCTNGDANISLGQLRSQS